MHCKVYKAVYTGVHNKYWQHQSQKPINKTLQAPSAPAETDHTCPFCPEGNLIMCRLWEFCEGSRPKSKLRIHTGTTPVEGSERFIHNQRIQVLISAKIGCSLSAGGGKENSSLSSRETVCPNSGGGKWIPEGPVLFWVFSFFKLLPNIIQGDDLRLCWQLIV